MNDWRTIALVLLSVLTACDSAEPRCTTSFTPGEKVQTSPDACTSARSDSPPLSSATYSDHCVQCTPRCGATKVPFGSEGGDEYYTDTDLPAGACTDDGERCDMEATAPLSTCNGVVVGCAVNEYRCSCTHGKWKCVMTSQGGGACGCDDDGGQ